MLIFGVYSLGERIHDPTYIAANAPAIKQAPGTVAAGSGSNNARLPVARDIVSVSPPIARARGESEDDEYGEDGYRDTVVRPRIAQPARTALAISPAPAPVQPAPQPASRPAMQTATNKIYKDGTFTGPVVDAYYGNVQVNVTTKSDRIVDVQFLDYPHDRNTSVYINSYATPALRSEAIQIQGAQVDTVSGATATSGGFRNSLASALAQARI